MRPSIKKRKIDDLTIVVAIVSSLVAVASISFAASVLAHRAVDTATICALDRTAVFQQSAVGVDANKQLLELKAEIEKNLLSQRQGIQQDYADQRESAAALQQMNERFATLQRQISQKNKLLEAVREAATNMVIRKIEPSIMTVSRARHCNALIAKTALIYVGTIPDITENVVQSVSKNVGPLDSNTIKSLAQRMNSAPTLTLKSEVEELSKRRSLQLDMSGVFGMRNKACPEMQHRIPNRSTVRSQAAGRHSQRS